MVVESSGDYFFEYNTLGSGTKPFLPPNAFVVHFQIRI